MPVFTSTIDRDRRAIDVAKVISDLYPSADPFMVMLLKAGKEDTDTAEYHWFDDEPVGWWTQTEDAATATATKVEVTDSTIFAPADIVKVCRTGEIMRVTAVDDGEITVVRGYGTTAAAAILDEDWLVVVTNAMEENSNAPESKLNQPNKFTNFTQIVRTPFDESMTSASEIKRVGGKERARLRAKKLLEHRLAMSRAAYWSEKSEGFIGSKPIRTTGGVNSFITTNRVNVTDGKLTEALFEEILAQAFDIKSGGEKLLVCGRTFGSAVNMIAQSKIVTSSGATTYGIRLPSYVSFHGTVHISVDRTFDKQYAGDAFILDMKNIKYCPLRGRDTRLRPDIQSPDLDGWKDEYITEFGMMVRQERTHMAITGVTGFDQG